MFNHYLRTALRGLGRHKGHTVINIVGLASGFLTCLIIASWVAGEISYDRFHAHANSIYRVTYDVTVGSKYRASATSMAPLAPAAVERIPEVTSGTRLRSGGAVWLAHEDTDCKVPKLLYADTSFFDIFSFTLLSGPHESALRDPYTAVLSEQTAHRLFGGSDPVGQTIRVGDQMHCTITGVAADCPPNSHLRFDVLVSFATLVAEEPDVMSQWGRFGNYTYLLVGANADREELEDKLNSLAMEHIGAVLAARGIELNLHLQRLTDIHLYSDLESELSENGSVGSVYTFSAIALVVLVMASLDFISLATARLAERGVEVNLRKALGATRGDFVYQSAVDALLVHAIAIVPAVAVAIMLLMSRGATVGLQIPLTGHTAMWIPAIAVAGLLLLAILGGLLTALSSPAITTGRRQIARVRSGRWGMYARRVIVILQLTAVTMLIIGTLSVGKQVRYLRDKDLGFQWNGLIYLADLSSLTDQTRATFRDEIRRLPGVQSASLTTSLPIEGPFPLTTFVFEGEAEADGQLLVSIAGDAEYINTLGLEVVRGRGFSADLVTDSTEAVLINETAGRLFGGQNLIGQTLSYTTQTAEGPVTRERRIIGVVRDFNFKSLHGVIEPLVIAREPLVLMHPFDRMAVRVESLSAKGVLAAIETLWRSLGGSNTIEYDILDDVLTARYSPERRVQALVMGFSALAIVVGCLGLLGMISYSTTRRMKEIAIRKTLGAGHSSIIRVLLKETVLLAGVSVVLACPLAYLFVQAWYARFAYHTTVGIGTFTLACAMSLAITVLTTGYHAIRAAFRSPVLSLRCE